MYHEDTGSYIRWDDGLSAADILKQLNQTVVGEKGYFNKILILFDEFGQFIEYASAYPMQAGEAALQQILEVVQNGDGNIVMVRLINLTCVPIWRASHTRPTYPVREPL